MYQYTDTGAVMRVATMAVVAPGDPLFAAWLAAGNVPAPSTLQAAQAAIWERIKGHRDAVKAGGVQVGGNWFHSDADSRIQQLGLVMMGASMPAGLLWKTMAGSFVLMTPALALQIFQATAARDAQVFGVAEQHRGAMQLAGDPSAYDYSAGWPAVYGGPL